MDLTGRRILVVGMAKSGIAAAKFLQEKKARVTVTDAKTRAEAAGRAAELEALGIELALGNYPGDIKQNFAMVVTSPGVPLTVPPLKEALETGVPVLGELELAYRFTRATIVAITGTNGKTTTTTLIGEMFSRAGRQTCVAGNIGVPLISEAEGLPPEAVIVAEVSSFQLETTKQFRPRVSVILNVTPDHLDRHGSVENYAAAKAAVFANQEPEECTVLNADDPMVSAFAGQTKGRVIFFSRTHNLNNGICLQAGQVVIRDGTQITPVIPAAEIRIPGTHNLENAMAAVAAGWAMGLQAETMAETLRTFPGVAHRLEFAGEVNGVTYINDSKGTNPDAAIKALESYQCPIVLIAGGKSKGSDFTDFAAKMRGRVHTLVVVGQTAEEIAAAAQKAGVPEILRAKTFEETVSLAAGKAQPGDIVLLSPACASWDMFNNFEERGDLFKQLVRELKGGH